MVAVSLSSARLAFLPRARPAARLERIVPAAACSKKDLEMLAKQLYEDVWSTGNVALLDDIMSQEHSQRDMVWQPDTTGGGRERMANGITAYRKMMPDLVFTLVGLAGDEASQRCYVEFEATGTEAAPQAGEERRAAQIAGAAVLQVEDGKIAETRVYRVAPAGERAMFVRLQQEAS